MLEFLRRGKSRRFIYGPCLVTMKIEVPKFKPLHYENEILQRKKTPILAFTLFPLVQVGARAHSQILKNKP